MRKIFSSGLGLIFSLLLVLPVIAAEKKDQGADLKDYSASFTYDSEQKSPDLDGLGVQIALDHEHYRLGRPVQVHGAYKIDQQYGRQIKSGDPLREIKLIVVRRDQAEVWSGNVVIGPEWAAVPAAPRANLQDADARQAGYFNGDLAQICPLLKQPGSYWVMATMGDYVSDRVEFIIGAH